MGVLSPTGQLMRHLNLVFPNCTPSKSDDSQFESKRAELIFQVYSRRALEVDRAVLTFLEAAFFNPDWQAPPSLTPRLQNSCKLLSNCQPRATFKSSCCHFWSNKVWYYRQFAQQLSYEELANFCVTTFAPTTNHKGTTNIYTASD